MQLRAPSSSCALRHSHTSGPAVPHAARTRRTRALVAGSARNSNDARTASVQVALGSATAQAVLQLTQPESRLVEASMAFPLGLVLESVDGKVVVTEVTPGGAADEAGCREGDVLRATTAFAMQMTYPAANVLLGGVGRPRLAKVLLPTDRVAFAKVMDAVRSNTPTQGGDGSITLVLERGALAGGSSSGSGSSGSGSSGSSTSEGGSSSGSGGSASSNIVSSAGLGTGRAQGASAAGVAAVPAARAGGGLGGGQATDAAGGDASGAVFDPRIFQSLDK